MMRRSRNIFESEAYHGAGIRTASKAMTLTIVLSVISLLATIVIVAKFDEITARIAIFVANLLSTGFPVLIAVIVIIYFVVRIKWRIRRNVWRW